METRENLGWSTAEVDLDLPGARVVEDQHGRIAAVDRRLGGERPWSGPIAAFGQAFEVLGIVARS